MTLILQPTPDVRRLRCVVGTAIRKPVDILAGYLASLAQQRPVPGLDLTYHFILDHADPDAAALVHAFVDKWGGIVENGDEVVEGQDFNDQHPTTHQWAPTAMARVGRLKNRILARARETHADAVWFVDADLILDPGTLRSLWYSEAPIACAVYWTRWQNTPHAVAAPQVWLRHPYVLMGQGYADEGAFRAQLLSRQLTRVWGQGACTLLRRAVLDKGVDFSYVPGVSTEGMMAGEDRHFCLRADAAHLSQVADPWPHIFHVYHPEDRAKIAEWLERVSTLHVGPPAWLNLHLRLLEPVPTGPGQLSQMPPAMARVRVGCGQLLPDLERQALEHLDGEPFIAEVRYPLHHPVPLLRGQKRLVEVTVVDWKVDRGMPVIEDEIVDGLDPVVYTPAQMEAV